MKRTVFTSIIMFILVMSFVSCGWNVEIVDPREPIENNSELIISEEKEPDTEIPLAGDYPYSVLEVPEDFVYSHIFEFGEKILFVGEKVFCFNAENGKLIYEDEITAERIYDAEEYYAKEGFDYRIILEDGVIYKNSEDPEKELFEDIPDGLIFENYGRKNYDVSEEKFVFDVKEGVMLSDKNGENEKLVLDNELLWDLKSVLPNFEWDQSFGNPYYFADPHFILGGTKIAAIVFSWEGIEQGFVVYDIAEDKIEFGRFCPEPWVPFFPIEDRYVIVHGSWVYTEFYDAETGEFFEYKSYSDGSFDDDYGTYDFKSVIAVDYDNGNDDPVDYTMMSSYLCTSKTLGDRTKPFLHVTDNTTNAGIYAAGKNYAVISLYEERDETVYCVAKYSE